MTKNEVNRALLIVLDGVGLGPKGDNNGWSLANTPNIDLLLKDYPSTQFKHRVKVLVFLMDKWVTQK